MARAEVVAAGLVLLTGGLGRRLGGPKHLQPHPQGGTWASWLVDTFATVFPDGPVQLLGEPLPDRPELPAIADPQLGPGRALAHWAGLGPGEPVARWWVVACDQVRWTPLALAAWHARAAAADPQADHWVLARHGGRIQYLGGWLSASLRTRLAQAEGAALAAFCDQVPTRVLDSEQPEWLDVDTPEELRAWLGPAAPG